MCKAECSRYRRSNYIVIHQRHSATDHSARARSHGGKNGRVTHSFLLSGEDQSKRHEPEKDIECGDWTKADTKLQKPPWERTLPLCSCSISHFGAISAYIMQATEAGYTGLGRRSVLMCTCGVIALKVTLVALSDHSRLAPHSFVWYSPGRKGEEEE